MSDVAVCDICGTSDLEMVVQHGSYTLACKGCGNGPATSFVAIAPHLTSHYRAAIIDDDWQEIELVAEGGGPDFMNTFSRVARSGAKVLIKPLGS